MSAAASVSTRRKPSRPARVPRPRPVVGVNGKRFRPKCYHRDKEGDPLTRDAVVAKMRRGNRFSMVRDSYRPDLTRVCRGKVQMAILLTIFRYTLGEHLKPEFTVRPILDRDIAYENGISIEGVRDEFEDLVARGVIERKGAEGAEFYRYRCCVESWRDIATVKVEGRVRKDDCLPRAHFENSPSESEQPVEAETVTGKTEGEGKENAQGVRTPSEQLSFRLVEPQNPAPKGNLVPIGDLTLGTVTARLHCRAEISCQTCHTPVIVATGCRSEGDDVIVEVLSPTLAGFEPEIPPLFGVLSKHGYSPSNELLAKIARQVGAMPLQDFERKLYDRNHYQGGRSKPASGRLPEGVLPEFAAQVSRAWSAARPVKPASTPTQDGRIKAETARMILQNRDSFPAEDVAWAEEVLRRDR